ncbi:MAG: hypothetical protein QXV73_05155 [Candidatus Micrarchaeia archaeon]
MLKLSAVWDIFSTRDEIENDLTTYLVHPDKMSDTLDDALERLSEFLATANISDEKYEDISELFDWFSDAEYRQLVLEFADEM